METLQSSVPPGPVGPSPRVTGWTFEMVCCPLSTASVQAPNAAAAQLSWTLGKESRTKFLCTKKGIIKVNNFLLSMNIKSYSIYVFNFSVELPGLSLWSSSFYLLNRLNRNLFC